MFEQRGIDDDDVRWMRRDLVSSLLGVHWFGTEGHPDRSVSGQMVEAATCGLGWTSDRNEDAHRLLRRAVAEVGAAAGWSELVDRIVELAEEEDRGISGSGGA